MSKERFRKVSKEEFNKFIEDYPIKLDSNVIAFCEPPVLTYCDFENYNGWEAVIAKAELNDSYSKDNENENEFYIINLTLKHV